MSMEVRYYEIHIARILYQGYVLTWTCSKGEPVVGTRYFLEVHGI